MFTGIVETLGEIKFVKRELSNLILGVSSPFLNEVKIDQSVSHNGVCLTIFNLEGGLYYVTLIDETLKKTNFNSIKLGDFVNLERCLKIGDRLDGHFVTGHVDIVGVCIGKEDVGGSWKFTFTYPSEKFKLVEKGSVTINGVSLTVVDESDGRFSVHIIPYTFENTTFRFLNIGDGVNLEFDILGKYVARLINNK